MAVQSIMRLLASSGLLVVIALAMVIQPIRAYYCQFWNPDCIDPLAQTAVPFNFEPLYPDPLYLFYAFDASTDGSTGQPVTKTSFWLRYGGTRVNRVAINGNRTLEIAMRVGNLTGYPAGGHNACDYVLGSQCTETIIQTLQYSIYSLIVSGQNYTNPLATVLAQMQMYPTPANFSCSPYFFDVQSFPAICITPPLFTRLYMPYILIGFFLYSVRLRNLLPAIRRDAKLRLHEFPLGDVVYAGPYFCQPIRSGSRGYCQSKSGLRLDNTSQSWRHSGRACLHPSPVMILYSTIIALESV